MKPILFSTAMVQALLAGRKTMTRRVIKGTDDHYYQSLVHHATGKHTFVINGNYNPSEFDVCEIKPKYKAGDILWVRESFYAYGHWTTITDNDTGKSKKAFQDLTKANNYLYQYHSDWQPKQAAKFGELGWHKRPSLFMPREACRLFLKVTAVRAERLHDITEVDAFYEGVLLDKSVFEPGTLKVAFRSLWNSINGPQSWDDNPWVWVYQFERVDQ